LFARGHNRVNRSLSGDHRAFLDCSGEQIYLVHYYNIHVQENDEVKRIVEVTLGDGFGESRVLIDDVDTVSPKSTSTNKLKKGRTAEAVEKVLGTISESLGLRTKYQEDQVDYVKGNSNVGKTATFVAHCLDIYSIADVVTRKVTHSLLSSRLYGPT
jgi:hypothetical protein